MQRAASCNDSMVRLLVSLFVSSTFINASAWDLSWRTSEVDPILWTKNALNVTYLGSYELSYQTTRIDCNSGIAQVHFHVHNSSTIESATHPPVIGYTAWWHNNIGGPLNDFFSSGPMSKTEQIFDWNELLDFKGNPCCKN